MCSWDMSIFVDKGLIFQKKKSFMSWPHDLSTSIINILQGVLVGNTKIKNDMNRYGEDIWAGGVKNYLKNNVPKNKIFFRNNSPIFQFFGSAVFVIRANLNFVFWNVVLKVVFDFSCSNVFTIPIHIILNFSVTT